MIEVTWDHSNQEFYALVGRPRVMFVDTTGFHGASHAVETMDVISQAPSLPVKIYLDK